MRAWRERAWAGWVLIIALAGCVRLSSPVAPESAWRFVALGLCEDYPEESRTIAAARRDLEVAQRTGAKILRVAFGWDAMEPERGVYDWSFWDEFVEAATRDHGVQLIPYVCYTPRWASKDQGNDFWRSPPRDPEDFARFMNAIVSRYRHAIRSWELWNEPDNRAYWLGTTEEFAALLAAGSRAVRAADPSARVVLGGIATELDFLEALFRDKRVVAAVDVVNLHSYFETWHPDPIERLPEFVGGAAEIVREHGEREPLWMAETGYSSVGGRAAVSEVYQAHWRGEHTADAQAAALVRTVILGLATQQLDLIAWYRINDLPPKQDVIGDNNNRHLGLRTASGVAKPAEGAFAQLSGFFGKRFRVLEPRVEVIRQVETEPVVRVFALEDGRLMVAAWMAHAANTVPVAPVPDTRAATVRVSLPFLSLKQVTATDAAGNPAPPPAVERDAGATMLRMELRGGGVLLTVVEP